MPNRQGAGLGLTKGDWGFVGWKLLALGTGPIALLVSVAQLTHVHSHGTGLAATLAVGDGCRVRGAVVTLPYPVVFAFPWLVYLVTYLHIAAGGFVLELPRLVCLVPPAFMYLVLPVFELFMLNYPVFIIIEELVTLGH